MLTLGLFGCEPGYRVGMHNPQTGEKISCGILQKPGLTETQVRQMAACEADYKARGFVMDERPDSPFTRPASAVLPQATPGEPDADEVAGVERDDPVALKCAASEAKRVADLRWTIIAIRVSRNPRWGTVWRADEAPDRNDSSTWFRIACSGHNVVVRPLVMFDQTQNIPPLK